MKPAVSASTRLLVLLGDPVSHSLSPAFQNAAIAADDHNAVYLALRVDGDRVGEALRVVALAGGAGNVTIPHKASAASAVDRRTDEVRLTGACNTFWLEDGEIWGDNTDVVGFLKAAETLLASDLAGARLLLLGAGGSAHAVAAAATEARVGQLVVVNRSRERAEALVTRYRSRGNLTSAHVDSLRGERFDLVVNATSLGLRPEDPPPLDDSAGILFDSAMDLVYRPERTTWIRHLQRQGMPAEDGLEMLLQQGAASFQRWFGVPPDFRAMREALPAR